MSAADGSSSSGDDEDYGIQSANLGSRRFPVHDCCEFEDADSLRRLIFVPQDDSEDDRSSGSNDSRSEGKGDASSSDDNDSAVAAHAAAIGHSPLPPKNVDIAMAPVGATAAVAAGMGANAAPDYGEVASQDRSGAGDLPTLPPLSQSTDEGSPIKTKPVDPDQETESSKAGEEEKESEPPIENDTVQKEASPSAEGDMDTSEVQTPEKEEAKQQETSVAPEDAPNEASDDKDVKMATSEQGEGSPENSVPASPTDEKTSKKRKRDSFKKPKEPTYYCPYDLNERDEDKNTPLHIAIHARKLEHVKLLLEAGASVRKVCDGSPYLHTAISIGAIPAYAEFAYECVVVLTEYDADISQKNDSLNTPLYLACAMNLPKVVTHILGDSMGHSTLNDKADRSGGRPLHAAAKFDAMSSPAVGGVATLAENHTRTTTGQHHPDGTISHAGHHIPGLHDAPGKFAGKTTRAISASTQPASAAVVTQILLSTPGIEIDAVNTIGQTPLHVACSRGNWAVVRLLLQSGASPQVADKRGFTPGQLALKRGMPIPVDLMSGLGDPLTSTHGAPPRDLIVDPDTQTLLVCHELCMLHRTCPPISRDDPVEPPPENVRRLHVLLNEVDGILKSGEFGDLVWVPRARRVSMVDVLKVHEYTYVEAISKLCNQIPDHPAAIAQLDSDTTVSRWSFESALRAAGSVCDAVDKVVAGDVRNAFCAVRPPGHHAGPRGIVRCPNDPEGSHGFCLLNNVAIGAAYARSMYRNEGIRKIAIVDFDVHHGNGTEEIVRQLIPNVEKYEMTTPFAKTQLENPRYKPWLDESDINDVFFASAHGYGPKPPNVQPGWFYPASGASHVSDAILNPSVVEAPNLTDFILSQSWTRMGETSMSNRCRIINCGLDYPRPHAIQGTQRLEVRDTYRKKILPFLRDFDPDIIFISAGFDAHKRDSMNYGFVGMVEEDYEWVTEQLVKIANTCCNGRIVSVLEGGYKIHGGIISPFARSVASHVRALVDGGRSRELFDPEDCVWESQFERHIIEERERKRRRKEEQFLRLQLAQQKAQEEADSLMNAPLNDAPVPADSSSAATEEPSRKRRRKQVDYKELFEQMKREKGGAI